MNKIIKVTALAILALFFTACGGSTESTNIDKTNYGTNERMVPNEEYIVNSGDKIEKLSENPVIETTSDLSTGKTIAKLISGEASIIRY